MAMHFNRYYCGKCHLTYLIKKDLQSATALHLETAQ